MEKYYLNKNEVKRNFINDVYGNKSKYLKERKRDFSMVSFNFSLYIDSLLKDGYITEDVYNSVLL